MSKSLEERQEEMRAHMAQKTKKRKPVAAVRSDTADPSRESLSYGTKVSEKDDGCLSEANNHPLMWADYASSHKGFCIGYVCPTGILNPRCGL
jgi:hypothetical protein